MPYEKRVERAHPALIQMILDDSGSMQETMPGTSDTRYQWVERYAGTILTELLARSTTFAGNTPTVRPRYYLDVLKYGNTVVPWSENELDIGAAAKQFDAASGSFGLGGKLDGTDTASAFKAAYDRMQVMLNKEQYRNSFPPMIFHLTDGESQTDAEAIARQIATLSTADGNVLIVNGYIGTQTALSYTDHRDFAGYVAEAEVGSNPDNLRLFHMSSVVPDTIRQNLIEDAIFPSIRPDARLFFDVRTKDMLKHVLAVVGSSGSRMRA